MRRGVVLSTCEHLLSALRGSGVDNCFIDLDNIEIPIMDGSSEDFIALIENAGVVEQNAARRVFRVLERVEFEQGDRKDVDRAFGKVSDRLCDRLSAPVHQPPNV